MNMTKIVRFKSFHNPLFWFLLLKCRIREVKSWTQPPFNPRHPSSPVLQSRRESQYRDTYYEGEDEYESYWDEPEQVQEQRGGMYKVYFNGDVDPKETQLDWEVCYNGESEALVLLPPAAVERPTAIVHFVGGTFFGSAPKLWYRKLLEGLVRNTQCAIVVTPIPVTLFQSPLQHVDLSRKLQRAFANARRVVLEDEYGDLEGIPICGLGHSLGARLLVVAATLNQNKPRQTNPSYKSMVLISFTNYGASEGIPGISALLSQSRKVEQKQVLTEKRRQRMAAQRARQDWWTDDDYEGDVDNDWDEVLSDLQEIFQEQASRVKIALTPRSKDLEVHPSPEMLWKALKVDKRYCIPETLIIQFDDDLVDQSAKIAQILHENNSSAVKFCRLRGTHLSPVSVNDQDAGGWLELPSRASKAIWKIMRGRNRSKAQEATMRDLRQSIARYISDVVTK